MNSLPNFVNLSPQPDRDYIEDIVNKVEDLFNHAIAKRYRNFFVRFDLRFPDDGYPYDEPGVFSEFIRVFIQNRTRKYGDVFFVAAREKVVPANEVSLPLMSVQHGLYDRVNEVPPPLTSASSVPSPLMSKTAVQHGLYEHASNAPPPLMSKTSVQHGPNVHVSNAKHGHYHLFFLFDGMNTQNIFGHLEKAEELWGRYLSQAAGRPISAKGLVQYGKEWWWPDDSWPFSLPRPQQCRGVMITRDGSERFDAHLYFCRQQALYLAKSATKDAFANKGRTWSSTHGIPPRPSFSSPL